MKPGLMAGIVALATGLMATQGATAQSLTAGQGVTDRPRPDYDPVGFREGSFTILPAITASVNATSNYLATDLDKRGDVYLDILPEVVANGDFGRARVIGRLFADHGTHLNLGSEDATQYGGSVGGTFEPSHDFLLQADLSGAHYIESRSSLGAFQQSRSPVRFEDYHAGLGASRTVGDLTVGVTGGIDDRNYHDTVLPDGTPVDQDFRDVRVTTIGANTRYSLRNGIGLILSGSYEDEHYLHAPSPAFGTVVDRDSTGLNIQGGVTLELTRLIYGTVQVGYLHRGYHDPRLDGFSGLSFNADLLWNITPLTTLRFRASRSVQDTSSPLVAGNTVSDFRIFVDHELFRYVILSGDVGYEHFRPNGIGVGGGGDQEDAGVGVRYLLDRRFSINASARYFNRTSDSLFLRYSAISGSVGLRVSF